MQQGASKKAKGKGKAGAKGKGKAAAAAAVGTKRGGGAAKPGGRPNRGRKN